MRIDIQCDKDLARLMATSGAYYSLALLLRAFPKERVARSDSSEVESHQKKQAFAKSSQEEILCR